MLYTFTSENFEAEVLKSTAPALVDFWAPWCGPCQMMGPIVDDLADEFENKKIKIGKCDIDANGELAEKYSIMSVPFFALFKKGEIIDSISGAAPREKLKAMIEKNLG